jgi:hypothetical protein
VPSDPRDRVLLILCGAHGRILRRSIPSESLPVRSYLIESTFQQLSLARRLRRILGVVVPRHVLQRFRKFAISSN